MSEEIEKIYDDVVASGLLPGVSVFAGDRSGKLLFTKTVGKGSLKDGSDIPLTESTMSIIASMTKLMTSVAVLQCVEDGKLDLDQDVKPLLPDIGKHGILTGFDGDTPVLEPNTTPITLRLLLTHTSGHEYDFISSTIAKWRASRNETPWLGKTVEEKSVVPLLFTPGTGFAYGHGHDWAGKAIEKATGMTLEEFMRLRIWTPLGIENDASFFPELRDDMKNRLATVSTLSEKGEPPAVYAEQFDARFGATDCLGGGPCWITPRAHFTFLSAVTQRDPKLLKPSSYQELFRPQLDEVCEKAMNDCIASSPVYTHLLGLGIAPAHRVTWSLAGMFVKQDIEGHCSEGTVLWAGATTSQWFIDSKAGVFGTCIAQILPPMFPPVMQQHAKFQQLVYQKFGQK
ncbi:unnamed protein product [Clonostachys rosea f. rosea IK726]|uniref:Beta-lactamase-related domain-containing protein n=2 Tax=Bionectria ochroleuca TaxID=29856 RepID=A0A0B7JYV6_BIOOC|nr:unnamed protein product [Clonostachys rosea f. rosea IK726]